MKIQSKAFLGRKREAVFCACLAGSGMLLLPGKATAQLVNLSDGGSTAVVNLGNTGTIGMNSWDVGAGSELNQQWFWYQIGNGAVQSINQLGNLSYAPGSTDGGLDQNELTATYSSSQLSVTITYELQGSGMNSGTANIFEGITLVGTGLGSTNVNLFQYSNFNLLGEGNDTVQVLPDGPGAYNYAQQNNGATAIAEGIISPDANNAEVGNYASTLNDVEAGTLDGNAFETLYPGAPLTAGPDDVAWAFEWTAAGGNLEIAKQKQLSIGPVPEPSTVALIALGLGACGFMRRRRS